MRRSTMIDWTKPVEAKVCNVWTSAKVLTTTYQSGVGPAVVLQTRTGNNDILIFVRRNGGQIGDGPIARNKRREYIRFYNIYDRSDDYLCEAWSSPTAEEARKQRARNPSLTFVHMVEVNFFTGATVVHPS